MPQPPAPSPLSCAWPVPLVARVSMRELLAFRRLMAAEGWPVDVARMCYDRIYARQCLAHAHTSARQPLRVAALALFVAYHPKAAVPLLH